MAPSGVRQKNGATPRVRILCTGRSCRARLVLWRADRRISVVRRAPLRSTTARPPLCTRAPGICLATSDDDLRTWRRDPNNPVIAGPPAGMDVFGFRDPFVFQCEKDRCLLRRNPDPSDKSCWSPSKPAAPRSRKPNTSPSAMIVGGPVRSWIAKFHETGSSTSHRGPIEHFTFGLLESGSR
jgi:hypothetical protein